MTALTIKTASPQDEDAIMNIVLAAFSTDPAARWLYPDPRQYLMHFPSFIRAFGGKAFEHGSAYYTDGYSGAALWFPPDVHADEKSLIALLRRTIPEREQADVFKVLEQMESYHPADPHWYLPMIAVDPAKQGNGYGSALLKYTLVSCDRENKLAYLESSNPKNIPLYERHGFEQLGTIQVGGSPPIFPMVRKPGAGPKAVDPLG